MGTSHVITDAEMREHASLEVHTIGFREFTPSRDGVREVRHFVKDTLEHVGVDSDDAFECQLVADELAANAVLHAGSVFSVAVELTEEFVRIAVRDESNRPPEPQRRAAEDERGRGLVIVSGTASGWGSVTLGRGKEIWADVTRTSA
jgi:anti-sigma regulatory factor (Ser/Thr protein kinase)